MGGHGGIPNPALRKGVVIVRGDFLEDSVHDSNLDKTDD